MKSKKLQVCLSPALLPYYDLTNTIAVVVDIFRASSSMCYGLANGAKAIIPVAEIAECRTYEGKEGYLLAAERNGEVVEGFDFGNSPFSYTEDKVKGKTVVLTTTNGTRAIQQCSAAAVVAVGSFLNITALSNWLKSQNSHVLLVCAGWKNHASMEDTLFGGAVVSRLHTTGDWELDDSAHISETIYLESKNNLGTYTAKSSHAKRMQRLDISQDVAFCLQEDQVSVIPVMHGDRLICLPGSAFTAHSASA